MQYKELIKKKLIESTNHQIKNISLPYKNGYILAKQNYSS